MLTFVGLGLYDLGDISLKGLECIRDADTVYLEAYTSRLMGTGIAEMEALFGKEIRVLGREDVEQDPQDIIEDAVRGRVAFLTAGDPMVSTTHADLRMRAAAAGVATSIIHASSISSAAPGLSGLQNYRFGKSCSIPFPAKGWFPTTLSRRSGSTSISVCTRWSTSTSRRAAICVYLKRSPSSRRWRPGCARSIRPLSMWASPGQGRGIRWSRREPVRD